MLSERSMTIPSRRIRLRRPKRLIPRARAVRVRRSDEAALEIAQGPRGAMAGHRRGRHQRSGRSQPAQRRRGPNPGGEMAHTRHPEAAWAWVRYLLEPETQVRFNQITGSLPARQSAWEVPALASASEL